MEALSRLCRWEMRGGRWEVCDGVEVLSWNVTGLWIARFRFVRLTTGQLFNRCATAKHLVRKHVGEAHE